MEENAMSKKEDEKINIVPVLVALIAFLSAVSVAFINGYFNLKTAAIEAGGIEEEEPVIHIFNNTEIQTMGKDGLRYIECQLTVNPVTPQYKVVVYPYLWYEKSEKYEYILIEKLYTQDQYIADENGTCLLKREDITKQLEEAFIKEIHCDKNFVGTGCLVAIKYYIENEEKTEIYELSSGQLQIAKYVFVHDIIGNSQNNKIKKFNVAGWPSNEMAISQIVKE